MIKLAGKLRSYEITGTVHDNGWLYRNRELLEDHMREDMKYNNVLPVLDLPITLACAFEEEKNMFSFELVSWGYEVPDAKGWSGVIIKDWIAVSEDAKKVMPLAEF